MNKFQTKKKIKAGPTDLLREDRGREEYRDREKEMVFLSYPIWKTHSDKNSFIQHKLSSSCRVSWRNLSGRTETN